MEDVRLSDRQVDILQWGARFRYLQQTGSSGKGRALAWAASHSNSEPPRKFAPKANRLQGLAYTMTAP